MNSDGWFVTAAHNVTLMHEKVQQAEATQEHMAAAEKIRRRRDLDRRAKQKRLRQLGSINTSDPASVIINSGGVEGWFVETAHVIGEVDLAVAKIGNFNMSAVAGLEPMTLRGGDVRPGELLCRIGYPFHQPQVDKEGTRITVSNLLPAPMFANEALVSRYMEFPGGGKWIETSTPGLPGQSGGPLLDERGMLCGIQCNTQPYPMDLNGVSQPQYYLVGRCVHVETIRSALTAHGVDFTSEK